MKKLISFTAVFVSLLCFLVITPGVVLGCAGPSYEDNVSFFEFSLANDPLFRKFHYTEISPPIGPLEAKSSIKRDYYDNLVKWQQFTNTKSTLDEIQKVIYDSENKSILLATLAALKGNTPVDTAKLGDLAKNQWLNEIIKTKQTESLEYIIYAKDCEPWVTTWDPWDDPPARDLQAMQRLIDLGLARYAKATSDFIKLRYAYQVIRLAQYSDQPKQCIAYYDRLVPGLHTKSIITYWAMGHKAGALSAVGKPAESLVLFASIFDQSENMMGNAFQDFYIPDDAIWLECLNSVPNNHRQATLWMLRGLREDRLTLEPLKHLFELEPKSPRLEVMLIREINKVEQQYLTSAVFFPADKKNQPHDFRYVDELKAFVLSGADSGQIRQPGLWYLAAGYLSLIKGDFNQAGTLFTKAEAVPANTADLKQQIALVKNLVTIATSNTISPQIEEAGYTNLTWAGGLVNDYNNQAVYRSLLNLLGQKYLAAGEIPKAAGCFYKTVAYESYANYLVDIYSGNADLERMIALLAKKDKTKLETLIAKALQYSEPEIRYIEATKLMRQEKFPEALALYQKIPASYWNQYRHLQPAPEDEYYFNDPCEYSGGLWTSFEREAFDLSQGYFGLDAVRAKQVRFYTKLDFTAKVTALLEKARTNPQNADQNYWQIANGFFHTPFWGYNDPVWKGNLINELNLTSGYPLNVLDFSEKYQAKTSAFIKEYATRKIALQYYLKTIAATKDQELAAKCTALAHLCQYGFTSDNSDSQEQDWTYFNRLRKNYAGTKIYKHLVAECTTMQDFLGSQK